MENPKQKSPVDDVNHSVEFILNEQRRELAEARILNDDIDLAFNLQMQEAIDASLSLDNTNPNSIPQQTDTVLNPDVVFDYVALLLEDIERLDQERRDREACENLAREMRKDIDRRIHDQKLATEILNIPDNEWEKYGDNFHKPYEDELEFVNSESFKVYCKGMMSEEMIREMNVVVGGVGVAVCDSRDNVIFEVSKGTEVGGAAVVENGDTNDEAVVSQIEALIEGLNAALSLDLKIISVFYDDFMVQQYVTGRVQPIQDKISKLIGEVAVLQKKFTVCQPSLVPCNDVKFAFKLARNAIVSQIIWDAESSKGEKKKCLKETCVICYDDKNVDHIFSVDGCLHRYCFSCMKQHVEVKLLNGLEASCPHEGCKSEISIESCGQFLDPKLLDIMSQRKKENSIAVTEKVYCPQMRCSALMSKNEVLNYTNAFFVGAEKCGARKCMKCGIFFCINCRVPWHYNMACTDYKRYHPHPRPEDAMLNSLAKRKLWRPCLKCNHIIELAHGCYHITCRCGYEFCYTCGAPWKGKKPTCTCQIWDERNTIHRQRQ